MRINCLYKKYDRQVVFAGLCMELPEEQCTVLMGPSGCGKTTLLRLIAGLEKPDSGHIEDGPGRVSFCFQEDRLLEELSALKNIRLAVKNVPDQEILAALEEVGLSKEAFRPVRELSGGMKRRVAIIRALLAPYDTLLLDEPFKGLDEALKEKVMEYVKKSTAGRTVLLVTHDPSEAEVFCAAPLMLEGRG